MQFALLRRLTAMSVIAASTLLGIHAATAAPAGSAAAERVEATAWLTRVSCQDGGRIALRVRQVPDGYALTATARGLPRGSAWEGRLGVYDDNDHGKDVRFGKAARSGGWRVSAVLPSITDPMFAVIAYGPEARRHVLKGPMCEAVIRPARPLKAISFCPRGGQLPFAVLWVSDRPGQQVVRFLRFQKERKVPVMLSVVATIDGVERSRMVEDRSNRDGAMVARTTFRGDVTTQVRVIARTATGDHCSVMLQRRIKQ